MLHTEKNILRQEMRLVMKEIADTIQAKSLLIGERLMTIDAFRHARQTERLMSYVSMPLEVNTLPFFSGSSMIVPYCCDTHAREAGEIVPIRIMSLNELESSGKLNILEPKLSVRQDESRQVLPGQIDVVLVPGLAFDRLGNRLGRGKGFYDRFLCQLPADVLTIGLSFDSMIRERIPHGENDHPVKKVVTESRIWDSRNT